MQVEVGDDAMYPIAKVEFIAFQMPSSDILDLTSVLYVPSLTKNLLSVLLMTDVGYMANFDDQ